ncbi:hypothetical protein NDU88_005768 [Pleurodeles waltl]|uniref:Uncharacterized protein n=1 Tax=Pleurodeles waltl TaxID=8319 RepID=A0AAV7SMK4_PLEWA|nr:hypothetical protein NDU88_005768 [Pleurodeles waltl]
MQSTLEEPRNDNLEKEEVLLQEEEEGLTTDLKLQQPEKEEDNLDAEIARALNSVASHNLSTDELVERKPQREFRLLLAKLKIKEREATAKRAFEEKRKESRDHPSQVER